LPTPESPALLTCPTCDGKSDDCSECEGQGHVSITCCPNRIIGEDGWAIIGASRMAEKGILPQGGGSNDQSIACMEGIRYAWQEQEAMKARLAESG
jgi:hypothetical protein